jgi:sulfite exporter TauE/SafE
MSNSFALGALALGFLGSLHCAAMCGGFARAGAGSVAALHGGRIASYAAAGALAGAAGGAPAAWIADPALRFAAFALACAVLFATGLRMGGFAQRVRSRTLVLGFERMAAAAARRIGPPATTSRRFVLGVLWGWAPCGLVYAALPLALVSASASAGALAMAAFGLGTVPALLGAGWALDRVGDRSRRWAGALLMLLAVAALLGHAATDPLFCG